MAALFHHLYGEGKSAAITKLELFLTEWSRSYFVFALETVIMFRENCLENPVFSLEKFKFQNSN